MLHFMFNGICMNKKRFNWKKDHIVKKTRNDSTSCPCQRLPILTTELDIWWLWEYFSARANLQVRKHQQLHTWKEENIISKMEKKYYKIEISSGKRNYLLISLIALLTLSRPGLAPHSAAISSMGTELNTIDVITLKKSPKFF